MKRLLWATFLLLAFTGELRASTGAVFTAVAGKVEVEAVQGKATRPAQKGATVVEGETISTGTDAQATLQLFDGSQLKISPSTSFTLEKMQQPSLKDKVIKFKLGLGKLFATVRKLASSRSSFEIEAGGVVCGVRGTEFFTMYDPSTHKVDVFVVTGTVYSQVDQQIHEFPAGHGGSYLNGSWTFTQTPPSDNPPPHPQNPPSSTNGNPHPGFIASNPFYGFDGTGSDDFNTPLTNLPGGLPGITGTLGNNGTAELTHLNLNLQLGFPQFLP